MSIFEQMLSHIAVRADALEDDYFVDGILYCGKCNTPKEPTPIYAKQCQHYIPNYTMIKDIKMVIPDYVVATE